MANILIVDDDYFIRNLLGQILTLNKHDVLEASDGLEALTAVNLTALPDLIFMDHQMPKLSGIDCARKLKPLYPFLKIVLISGSFGIDDDGYLAANKCLFTDILLKPFRTEHVVSTVEYALGDTREERMLFLEFSSTAQIRNGIENCLLN